MKNLTRLTDLPKDEIYEIFCQKSEMILSAISICSAVKRVTSDSRGKRHPKSWDLICHNAARPDMKWMMSEYITI